MRPPAPGQAGAAVPSGETAELNKGNGLEIRNNLLGVEFLNQRVELLFRFLARNGKGVRRPFKLKK
jgi:hypothetical protein